VRLRWPVAIGPGRWQIAGDTQEDDFQAVLQQDRRDVRAVMGDVPVRRCRVERGELRWIGAVKTDCGQPRDPGRYRRLLCNWRLNGTGPASRRGDGVFTMSWGRRRAVGGGSCW
jgi:hypothetical protein